MAYVIPEVDRRTGSLFVRSAPGGSSVNLGSYDPAELLPDDSCYALAATAPDGSVSVFDFTTGASSPTQWLGSTTAAYPPKAISNGLLYVQNVDAGTVEGRDQMGTVKESYPMPDLAPDATAGTRPPYVKGPGGFNSKGVVAGIFRSSNGHVIAVTYTDEAAAVTDLTAKTTVPIPGLSVLDQPTLGTDGNIYMFGHRYFDGGSTYKAIEVDMQTLSIAAVVDTKVTPRDTVRVSSIRDPGGDGALFLVTKHAAGQTQTGYLWDDSNSGLSLVRNDLPESAGVQLGPGSNGTVWMYGGSAGASVSELDPRSGALNDVPSMSAPPGSIVQAVLGD